MIHYKSVTIIKRMLIKPQAMMTIFESNNVYFQSLNLDDMFAEPLIRQLLDLKKAWTPDYCARRDVGI